MKPSHSWYLPTRKHLAVLAIACGLLSPVRLFGQTQSIPSGTSDADIKTAAEKEGSTFPAMQAQSDSAQPRVCVTTQDLGPARSGEFTIGGNLSGASSMRAGRQGKVWWAPLYAARDMPPLLVRGRNLTNLRDTVRFVSSTVAWPVVPGAPKIPEEQRRYYFPSGITIPQPGRWLLIATSGQNWAALS
jgi:hypothetical protein